MDYLVPFVLVAMSKNSHACTRSSSVLSFLYLPQLTLAVAWRGERYDRIDREKYIRENSRLHLVPRTYCFLAIFVRRVLRFDGWCRIDSDCTPNEGAAFQMHTYCSYPTGRRVLL